jgi:hypothetical protein
MASEQAAMSQMAPNLRWLPEEPSGGWQGTVPLWPFDRPQPRGLVALVKGQSLEALIVCGHAYPMVEPQVTPLSVEPPIKALGWTTWHVAPNGALCLLQESVMWDPAGAVADLVPKISGWYIEYQLMLAGRIETMTETGLAADTSLDALLEVQDGTS